VAVDRHGTDRREVSAKSARRDAEHLRRGLEVTDPEATERHQLHVRQAGGLIRALLGDEHLSPMRGRHDPHGLVDGEGDVLTATREREAGVRAHAHGRPPVRRPGLTGEPALRVHAGRDGSVRADEGCERRVARAGKRVPAVARPRLDQHVRAAAQDGLVVIPETA